MDVSENADQPNVLINPEIIAKSDETVINEEGSLSVPGIYAKVDRHTSCTVKALDRHGKEFTLDGEELLSICIQHELDHLNGVLFVDYLSPLKRQRIKTKIEKKQDWLRIMLNLCRITPQKSKCYFAGTPDFAAKHLAALINSEHNVIAVYCPPDKPAGKRKVPTAWPLV
eukprot:TRINITY_DN30717_c0_g1_i1.p1 TRINITY_DN30717_c0_g1~~TRINITY_DN30717_c0_g1_i1.p1  ORF type:complete len:192 (-),score=43.96 TRINITY_DN30717_c0_g1_i1:27-536(-)